MDNIILCMKWGEKYDRAYVEKLKRQIEDNCSVPYTFYCITDNPTESYDIQLPATEWDLYYEKSKNFCTICTRDYNFQIPYGVINRGEKIIDEGEAFHVIVDKLKELKVI